ncbi:hypothetical protein [Candidatus Enterococcus huntleyi]|uniref:hypothetical protein n=1 Tax=Candidatus Enterococcus huntleyi TaxID=1857217 RepID=UPI00192A1A17|nr:hypothetical protein [Enterococcus sp. JM4C]
MEKIVCPHCGKKFRYEEITNIVSHADKEMAIVCPYCDLIAEKKVSHGYFVSTKIIEQN